MKNKYVVAEKDNSSGKIRPGKVLAKYSKLEYAQRDRWKLARRAGHYGREWHVGIFFNGALVG